MESVKLDEMINFAKRKGFVFPSGELYGAFSGFWDFGPLGVELKKNIKDAWWNFHVRQREDIVGIDGAIITNPKIWESSGHVESFIDVAVICKDCKTKAKIDRHEVDNAKCEKCGGELINKGEFNPMFTTQVGPIVEDSIKAYLRPETAQLIFANFKNVLDTSRLKLPFGIAQQGKAYRNEIAPRNFLFRSREFEQMEIEYFIDPDKKESCPFINEVLDFELKVYSASMQENKESPEVMTIREALEKKIINLPWHAYWLATGLKWFEKQGANLKNFRIRQHEKSELAHYSSDCWDLEYHFPFGWKELQGIADRGVYDLQQHEKGSKKELRFFDEETKKKILPMVVAEPSFGFERAFMVFMFDAYSKNEKGDVILKLSPRLAPVKVAILPLVKKDEKLVLIAKEIYNNLKKEWNIVYDQSGSVGRRYARNDEVGTPFCLTVDGESITNKDVTIRNRDDGSQKRIKISEVRSILRDLISCEKKFSDI